MEKIFEKIFRLKNKKERNEAEKKEIKDFVERLGLDKETEPVVEEICLKMSGYVNKRTKKIIGFKNLSEETKNIFKKSLRSYDTYYFLKKRSLKEKVFFNEILLNEFEKDFQNLLGKLEKDELLKIKEEIKEQLENIKKKNKKHLFSEIQYEKLYSSLEEI
jgi:hypothetical protein